MHNYPTAEFIAKSFTVSIAGFAMSLSEIESIFRIASLAVPMILSIKLYLKNTKKKKP